MDFQNFAVLMILHEMVFISELHSKKQKRQKIWWNFGTGRCISATPCALPLVFLLDQLDQRIVSGEFWMLLILVKERCLYCITTDSIISTMVHPLNKI